jgi:LacI family transcriptional regulator, galactose operon repressor
LNLEAPERSLRCSSDELSPSREQSRDAARLARDAPRVLVALDTNTAWSRGTLRGFMEPAHERGWTVLHYDSDTDLNWLMHEWKPSAVVIGPEFDMQAMGGFPTVEIVSVITDRSSMGIASVCLDEEAIATRAAEHLLGTGLKAVSAFRLDESAFALAREQAFVARARAAGVRVAGAWGSEGMSPAQRRENPEAMLAWLRALPRPCGIFTCTDGWGRTVARYARVAGLRVPEDIALIGVDNDASECELMAPPLSSVPVPWAEVGQKAAKLVHLALSGKSLEPKRVVVSPLAVVARRSSDVLAVDDGLVSRAVAWIRANAERRLTVGMVVAAVKTGRQRLERAFRRALDRTIQEEIRRSHVDVARRLLETTGVELRQIAQRSGFTNATLLNLAFQRELGMAPGAYRRQMQQALSGTND